jgi:hypothetical protein
MRLWLQGAVTFVHIVLISLVINVVQANLIAWWLRQRNTAYMPPEVQSWFTVSLMDTDADKDSWKKLLHSQWSRSVSWRFPYR